MEHAGLHTELESRLKALATHIDELSQMMSQAKGPKRTEDREEIEKLQRRHKALDDELRRLDREAPDLQHGARANIETGVNELTRWVEEHIAWIDSGYQAARRPKRLDS
jgi:predicted  nucleic acid-binding Zn-ribbon protein